MSTATINVQVFESEKTTTRPAFVKHSAPKCTLKPHRNYIPIENIMTTLPSIVI